MIGAAMARRRERVARNRESDGAAIELPGALDLMGSTGSPPDRSSADTVHEIQVAQGIRDTTWALGIDKRRTIAEFATTRRCAGSFSCQ